MDHYGVAVPQPVIAICVIECRHRQAETTYRKSTAITAVQSPDMPGADGAGKVTVLPRMIEVIVRIVATFRDFMYFPLPGESPGDVQVIPRNVYRLGFLSRT